MSYHHKRGILLVKKYLPGYGVILIPAYDSDKEKMQKMKPDKPYLFTLSDKRNPRHHRKMFAIFRAVVNSTSEDIFPDEEAVLAWVKWELGYVKPLKVRDKKIYQVESISFSTMGQTRFDGFYKKAVDLLAFLIGVDPQELEEGSLQYM